MRYFTGSRRRKRNTGSDRRQKASVEPESAKISDEAVDLPEIKRLRRGNVDDKTQAQRRTVTKSKKSKQQCSSDATPIQPLESQPSEELPADGESMPSFSKPETRTEELNDIEQLSSESDSSINMSDKRDSLTLYDTDECQSDHSFLRQQIKILKTPFQLEDDCPALARIRAKDSRHIPIEIIQNALRKVNNRRDDIIMRSLNRQAQRKVLGNLQDARCGEIPNETLSLASDGHLLERYKEMESRVANIEKVYDQIKQEHAQHKHIGELVAQLEVISDKFSSDDLVEQVKRTRNLGALTGPVLSDHTSYSHHQLVQMLFKD
ncbi:uncharacterized protein [Montipora foliosa]|uniref:uncharacterized protein isoform X1 n=1 Tax=Montipora foliosa TaxID=591990 RepID=UPI0035F15D4C